MTNRGKKQTICYKILCSEESARKIMKEPEKQRFKRNTKDPLNLVWNKEGANSFSHLVIHNVQRPLNR